jgi:hypothetical protein
MKVTTMGTRREPRSGWLWRVARGRRLDRNPLRRRSDRAETAILAGALVAFLAGGPAAALAGGDLAHGLARDTQRAQLATELQVTAVTRQAAPAPGTGKAIGLLLYQVPASWTAPRAVAAAGQVPVPLGTPAGTRVQVWSTLDGKIAARPLTGPQVASLTSLGRMVGVIALALVLAGASGLARHELDRRRFAAWDADWLATDSPGTGHRER